MLIPCTVTSYFDGKSKLIAWEGSSKDVYEVYRDNYDIARVQDNRFIDPLSHFYPKAEYTVHLIK